MTVTGLVLAAGAGTRFGGPKALARSDDGTPWIQLAVRALRDGGCDDVVVLVGASAAAAEALVPADATAVPVSGWSEGLAATLRAGVAAAARAELVVITPVDTPDASPAAIARVLAAARAHGGSALAQATYRGEPGHPVVIGRDHFAPLAAALSGDRGARRYLEAHGVAEIECADLWSGRDVDTPPRPDGSGTIDQRRR